MNTLLKLGHGYMSELDAPNRMAAGATAREVRRNWMIQVTGHSVRQQEASHQEDMMIQGSSDGRRREQEKYWRNSKPSKSIDLFPLSRSPASSLQEAERAAVVFLSAQTPVITDSIRIPFPA